MKNGSKYLWDAQELGKYWAKPEELFARAFEAFVEDKWYAKWIRDNYLVAPTNWQMNGYDVYPQWIDREKINEAIEKFIETFKKEMNVDIENKTSEETPKKPLTLREKLLKSRTA